MSERLWTVADVAAFLSASKSLVYKKAESGVIPCIRVGGLLRFDEAAVRRWALGSSSSPPRVVSINERMHSEKA